MRQPLLAGVAVAVALLALVVSSAAGAAAAPAGCTPATNVEAIVDDSLSMQTSDPNRLRVQGLDLLIATLPAETTLGAIEFGSGFGGLRPAANSVFGPEPVGANAAAMVAALGASINADDGLTDYNGAFALADSENPNAEARIFLTDGGHNEGEYGNGHLVHDVPTYVIGFGEALSTVADRVRLKRIAAETGGRYYALADSSRLQAAINLVGTELTCQAPPRTFSDELARGRAVTHTVAISAATGSARIALTWASPRDRFKLTGLRLVPPAGTRTPPRLRVERRGSATYSLIEVSGLSRGRLSFKVEATRVRSGARRATLTTQLSRTQRGN